MPKNPLRFGRRKSSGNAFEEVQEAATPVASPANSSFRVLERPEKINLNGPPAVRQVVRPFNSPLQNLRGRSAEELGQVVNRGSGGTTNSGSSGYYESSSASARHSSSSTLPSSVDAEQQLEEEDLFPRKTKTAPIYSGIPQNANEPLPPPQSFSTRAARAFSFGQKHNRGGSSQGAAPAIPPLPSTHTTSRSPERISAPQRERAMTTSSYASTAKPEVNLSIGTTDFGNDFGSGFGSMFETPRSERAESPLPPVPPVAAYHRTDSEPMFPPRTHSRSPFKGFNDDFNAGKGEGSGSPYLDERRNSRDALMSHSPLGSPTLDDAPPVPPHQNGISPAFLGNSKFGYSRVPERYSSPGPERSSQDSRDRLSPDRDLEKEDSYGSQQSQKKDDSWIKRVELHDGPQTSKSVAKMSSNDSFPRAQARLPTGHPTPQTKAGASRSGAMSPESSEGGGSLFSSESSNTTPKARKLAIHQHDDESLFDSSPLGPPSRALPPQHSRMQSDTPKKMTRAQYERAQRRGDSSGDQSDDEEHADEYDDEDETDRVKQMARQRLKQEANMSVYRQQMKKVTGGGPGDLPAMARPSLDRAAASAPAIPNSGVGIHLGGMGGQLPPDAIRGKQNDDDDDDVPLGILQAHGFPGAGRPPTRGENDNQRRASAAGSVAGGAGQGNLPPFARRLPADPYFGSSLVNQSNRESLGMHGSPSVYGGAQPMMPQPGPQMGHPGGLVGVIAGEERAKAARRGSPNPATGTYNPPSMPQAPGMPQMGAGMPGMPRTMSMSSMAPNTYMPSGMGANPMMMNPMGMMPQMQQPGMMPQNQDQMQQFMQMQMQVMQNMIAMQQQQMGQTPPPQQQQTPDYFGNMGMHNRRASMASNAPSFRGGLAVPTPSPGRAMTMMNPPKGWDVSPGAQRPNSAMPQTYSPSGLNIPNGGPGPGYNPSIAPSERTNVGQPSRYRPVTMGGDGTERTQSMASSLTMQGLQISTPEPPRPQSQHQSKSTIKLLDKPKGAPKTRTKSAVADDDDEDGWAEMSKKREEKKKSRFGLKKDKGQDFGDLYRNLD